MKTRFNTFDIVCIVRELQRLIGMRVNNIYDIDSKTYLIKLQRTEEKCVLLLESGNRFHSTAFEWPKNVAPSGFSMKMRKHLKNKRLEKLVQLGTDRIVDLQFGTNEAAYHIILELYDRGNILLTDYELKILYILRPHTEGEEVRFAVKEKYPVGRGRVLSVPEQDEIIKFLRNAKPNDTLKKVLLPHLDYGPALLEHVFLKLGFPLSSKIGKDIDIDRDIDKVMLALNDADNIMNNSSQVSSKGYIIQKKEERPTTTSEVEYFFSNQEFHPMLYMQHLNSPYKEFDTFDAAVDEFFSTLESQKIDMKAIQQEREAIKKLDNVKKSLNQRVRELEISQEVDKKKAELITRNRELVENAILAIQSALASQMSWIDIDLLVKEAQSKGDPVAKYIKQLKLEINHITLLLSDPYESDNSDEDEEQKLKPMLVDVDLALTAFANATKYYDQKRNAAKKQQKTLESQTKAFKSAEKKTKQTLQEVQKITSITKARKVYWFEKFLWFISSENYLVIGGRDQQQNELVVKRYMSANDIYVHADVHGASSVIIKNTSGQPVPPKTLNEAGTMAICNSAAWDAKVVTSAWWVNANQVSKTAPTGEYLTTGSFMVRGKKNYLPACHLIMGFGFLFKLEDGSIPRHKNERKIRTIDEDNESIVVEDEIEVEICEESDEEKEEPKDEAQNPIIEEGQENYTECDEDNERTFPDTHIKIQHFEGTNINLVTAPVLPLIQNDTETEKVVFLGDDKPVILKSSGRNRAPSDSKNKSQKNVPQESCPKDENDQKQQNQIKRGQKGKLKKIKEKYKDQDDEERKLRMAILQSAGKAKDNKKGKKGKEEASEKKDEKKNLSKRQQPAVRKDMDDYDEVELTVDVDMLDSFTGQPYLEDELLFAIPVVAPYSTLTNYKFKVKLTPGTAKRGKAARTAVSMFIKDRATTNREKDLLRSVKDEQLVRNIPGKVKLSAPKLQAMKK